VLRGHLRLAAQAIGLSCTRFVAFEMRVPDIAAFQQRGQGSTRCDLSGMPAQLLDLRPERRRRGHRRIDRPRRLITSVAQARSWGAATTRKWHRPSKTAFR